MPRFEDATTYDGGMPKEDVSDPGPGPADLFVTPPVHTENSLPLQVLDGEKESCDTEGSRR
jgi:hypothetical protein